MDNVQNCDSYVNILSSQSDRSYSHYYSMGSTNCKPPRGIFFMVVLHPLCYIQDFAQHPVLKLLQTVTYFYLTVCISVLGTIV
jgi:hypothetical protein